MADAFPIAILVDEDGPQDVAYAGFIGNSEHVPVTELTLDAVRLMRAKVRALTEALAYMGLEVKWVEGQAEMRARFPRVDRLVVNGTPWDKDEEELHGRS